VTVCVVGGPETAAAIAGHDRAPSSRLDVERVPVDGSLDGAPLRTADCLVVAPEGDDPATTVASVRDAHPVVPLVVVADGWDDDLLGTALTAGADDCLPRSLVDDEPGTVARRVERLVDRPGGRGDARTLCDAVGTALSLHDPTTGEVRYANRRLCELLGRDRETLDGMGVEAFTADVSGHDSERAAALLDEVEAGDRVGPVEWPLTTADGETRWVEFSLAPVAFGGRSLVLATARDITERQRREREYEQVFNMARDGVVVHDPDTGAVVDANEQVANLLGYDRAAFRERPMSEFFAADEGFDEATARERIRESAATDGAVAFEWALETADGETVWVEARHVLGEIGGEERVVAILRDVTERRRKTERLRQRERTLERLHETTRDLMAASSPEAVAAAAVEATGTVLGFPLNGVRLYDPDEDVLRPVAMSETTMEEVGPRPALDRGEGVHWEVLAEGEPRCYDDPSDVDDDVARPSLGSVLYLPLGDHGVLSVGRREAVGFSEDDRRLAGLLAANAGAALDRAAHERQLAEEREKYSTLVEQGSDGVAVVQDGVYAFVNDRFADITGHDRDALSGMSFEEVFAPEDRDLVLDRYERRIDGESPPRRYDVRVERPDGERRILELAVSRIRRDGEPAVLANFRDVTERVRAEERVRESERQLRLITERIDEKVYLTDPELSEVVYLAGYEAVWGRPAEEMHDDPRSFLRYVHPDDAPEFRRRLEAMVAAFTDDDADEADSYDFEYRIEHPEDGVRWLESTCYPVREDGGVEQVAILSRDVTDRKRRERRLASFDRATDDLATADTRETAVERAVDAAVEELGLSAVAVYLYAESEGRLEPVAASAALPEGDLAGVEPRDGAVWRTFAEGEPASLGAASPAGVESGQALSLGSHGVIVVGSADGRLDPGTLQEAHVLAATLEAALNHVESQRRLTSQQEKLRSESERATRLDRIAWVTRRAEAAITEASTRREVERAVCARLVEVAPFATAWTGEVDVGGDRIAPRAVAGVPEESVRGVDLSGAEASGDPHPAALAWRTGEPQVVDSVVAEGPTAGWRRRALERGYQSLCAVPLSYDGVTRGVLTVTAETPNAFDDRERETLGQLGASVGHALAAIERRRALESDETVELEFRGPGDRLPVARLARETDGRVRHRRAVRGQDGRVTVYYAAEADGGESLVEAAESVFGGGVTVVDDTEGVELLEVTGDDWFGSPLAQYGAVLRTATATPDETRLVVELPADADVRSFVRRLADLAPSLELTAQRQHREASQTPGEIRTQLRERLTERQYEALETAFAAGYFEWPRESSGEEVAARLDITQPTLNKHLRLAERALVDLVVAPDDEG
jgi:PAS domain S-box-containing protein